MHLDYLNTQDQPKLVWPPSFALARAYVDQLERSKGLDGGRITAMREALAGAEKASGTARQDALNEAGGRAGGGRGVGRKSGQGADAGGGGEAAGGRDELTLL